TLPSIEEFEIAEACLPGAGLGGYALDDEIRFVFSHGHGPRFWDTDGKEYIDYTGGAGALILGHAHPAVVEAAQAQTARGMHMFGALNDQAIRLAKRLVDDIPCAEKIAYATTGSEATAYAMRLARAFTGRDKVMKFEGAYHGNHDYALISTFPTALGNYPDGQADTGGQPAATRGTMMIAPYNDLEAAARLAEEHGEELAAIIVEPVQRIIEGRLEFLAGLRALCNRLGVVLIFDEVVTGFRIAYGGAQAALGITPDLASFGKVIGGSGALSAVAGKAEIIDLADPGKKGRPEYAYLNGTLHGNPVAAAATLATLDELAKPGTYDRLNAASDDFCAEAQKVLDRHGLPAIAANVGSLWQFLFMEHPPRSQADMMAGDAAAMKRLDTEMMKRGQYMLPGVRRFFSCVHGPAEVEETLHALDESCRVIAA
ncbi:MAG: aminotransferase class III-fold pyridoxal phosphate-dependent enzyme, partial [Xanthomonadales bacterium]|nr:aminotransferase class III-fold pyridoxal phosphate-dependent enzyme [Xanthomonadales bacterium]